MVILCESPVVSAWNGAGLNKRLNRLKSHFISRVISPHGWH
uniref:Uncharacterized protein n=1 Tax=virus sp. ctIVh9 TaxID=2826797 RepID=A0A8S5R8M5_9VIRU|nr:MAG TPA: hypothetical protein [virus sp. ctIVh9]